VNDAASEGNADERRWGPEGIHVVAPEHNSVRLDRLLDLEQRTRTYVDGRVCLLYVYDVRIYEQYRSHCRLALPYGCVYSGPCRCMTGGARPMLYHSNASVVAASAASKRLARVISGGGQQLSDGNKHDEAVLYYFDFRLHILLKIGFFASPYLFLFLCTLMSQPSKAFPDNVQTMNFPT
jgi:hypothetical protein